MKLQAVFWDYPEFQGEESLRKFLQSNEKNQMYNWAMTRFLEHGRVVDTFKYFSLEEISVNLEKLKLSQYARGKWQRLLEVYDSA